MHSDNAYPTSTERFFSTRKKRIDEKKSLKQTLDQVPLIKEVLTHLSDRIAATDSVKQTLVIAETYDLTKEQALVVADIVRQQLENEMGLIQSKVNDLSVR